MRPPTFPILTLQGIGTLAELSQLEDKGTEKVNKNSPGD
jgi:hypothetical protein